MHNVDKLNAERDGSYDACVAYLLEKLEGNDGAVPWEETYQISVAGRRSIIHTKYTLCLKKTAPLRIIWHNFTNSQHLLIIFGRERPYSILSW